MAPAASPAPGGSYVQAPFLREASTGTNASVRVVSGGYANANGGLIQRVVVPSNGVGAPASSRTVSSGLGTPAAVITPGSTGQTQFAAGPGTAAPAPVVTNGKAPAAAVDTEAAYPWLKSSGASKASISESLDTKLAAAAEKAAEKATQKTVAAQKAAAVDTEAAYPWLKSSTSSSKALNLPPKLPSGASFASLGNLECFPVPCEANSTPMSFNFTWKFMGQPVPVHTGCLLFGKNQRFLGTVYYGETENGANKIEHKRQYKASGEMAEGESICFKLGAVSSEVEALCFVASTPNSTFQEIGELRAGLNSNDEELCKFIPDHEYADKNAIAIAQLWRVDSGSAWLFEAIGTGYSILDPGPCTSMTSFAARVLRISMTNAEKKAMAAKPGATAGAAAPLMEKDSSGAMLLPEAAAKGSLEFRCSWSFGEKPLPVHTQCVKIGGKRKEVLGTVYYGEAEDGANKIVHARNWKSTGELADSEGISLKPSAVKDEVSHLCFVVSCPSTLTPLRSMRATLVNKGDGAMDLCSSSPQATGSQNAIVVGVLYRKNGSWAWKFVGEGCTIEDGGPCFSLGPTLQKICGGL